MLANNFSSYVTYADNGCHLWFGCKNPDGYGQVYVNGKTILAHRFIYMVRVGDIPKGMCVCHRCDTPACVNPKHLFLATHKDNIKDCVSKARTYDRNGATNSNAKLTQTEVDIIRRERANGAKVKDLAVRFGMGISAVSNIVNYKSWR